MPKTILKLFAGLFLLIATACAPGMPTSAPDPNAVNTAIVQTLTALPETSGPGIPVTGDGTPTPTATPEAPTPAATMTPLTLFTPTPVFTFTPGTVQVSVSVPTNCRVGPGVAYARVGALLVDEVAEVLGRHDTRDYWIIRNPDRPGETCWLWGEYATLTGNPGVLPVFTPPPSPTPSPGFTAGYHRLEFCEGTGWWVDIELENNGGITFNSIAMTVRDTTTNTVLALYSDNFADWDGCNVSAMRDNLRPGDELVVSSPAFTSDPRGHALRATITLCSNTGQSGTCVTESINFTP